MRRTWSRHAGTSVRSGATTPNRNGRVPPAAWLPSIAVVLSPGPGPVPGFGTTTNGAGPIRHLDPEEPLQRAAGRRQPTAGVEFQYRDLPGHGREQLRRRLGVVPA